jgi:hypothetical protein
VSAVAVARRTALKPHVVVGRIEDGVLFDAGDASFVLKEVATWPLVERLVALMDAGEPVERILERAPEKLADFFRKVLASLADHDMLLEVDEEAAPPTDPLRCFLEDRLAGRGVDAALRRWHDANVVVVGHGQAQASAAQALADAGCTRLTRITEGTPDLDGTDLLVYASDVADSQAIACVEAWLRERGSPGSIGAVCNGHACVLPAAQTGRPGFADLMHWLPPRDADAVPPGAGALALLGNVVAQTAINRFFDVEPAANRGQVAVVSPGLEVAYRMLVASAHGGQASIPFTHASKYEQPEDRALLPFEMAKIALEPWFDPLLGPFGVVADDRIEQMPMLQYPLRVRPANDGAAAALVVGWGLEHADGVLRGLIGAVEALAQSFLPGSAGIVAGFDEDGWKRRAIAHAVAGSDDLARRHRWAWAELAHLPSEAARVLLRLVQFHATQPLRAQLLWSPDGDAFVARVFHGDAIIGRAVAPDPVTALEEGLGTACSGFQTAGFSDLPFAALRDLPAPKADARVDDWRDAVTAAATRRARDVEFHLVTAAGFPPSVYCGYATLNATTPA